MRSPAGHREPVCWLLAMAQGGSEMRNRASITGCHGINRTKGLVLGLFAVYWVIVVVILLVAREVADLALGSHGDQRLAEIGGLLVLTALFADLSTGVIRGWRWTF